MIVPQNIEKSAASGKEIRLIKHLSSRVVDAIVDFVVYVFAKMAVLELRETHTPPLYRAGRFITSCIFIAYVCRDQFPARMG